MLKVLLVRVYSTRDSGDDAILRCTLRLLHQAFPDAEVTIAVHDVDGAQELGSDRRQIVGSLLSWISGVDGKGVFYVHRLRWLWYNLLLLPSIAVYRWLGKSMVPLRDPSKRQLLRAYREADLVLGSGGGYLYDARKASWWFVGVFMELALAIWLRKPLILLPQSIGPLPGPEQRWLVRWLVKRAQLVLIRDECSYQLLQSMAARGTILRLPDLAFAQRSSPPEDAIALLEQSGCRRGSQRPCVGLSVINWNAQHAAFTIDQQLAYEKALVELCDFLNAQGIHVIGLPQCCGPRIVEDDRLVLLRIRSQLRNPEGLTVLMEQPPPDLLQAVHQQLDLVIATRMHSAIYALNSHVPALVIGYLHKSKGMLAWLGWERWHVDISDASGPTLIERVNALSTGCAPREVQLVERVESSRQLVESLPMLLRSTWFGIQPENSIR